MSGFSFKRTSDPLDYLLTSIPSSSDGIAIDKIKLVVVGIDIDGVVRLYKQEILAGADY